MNYFKVDKIKSLIKELNIASKEYYTNNNPIMSDYDFDRKFDELKSLENEIGLHISSSPTQNVGYDIMENLVKVKHSIPLLSLDKTKDIDIIEKFANKKDTFLSLKLDGLTTELIYEDGDLVQASTRGNGDIGEDITHNAKVFKNIPLSISYKGYLKLVGESLIHKDDFDNINSKLADEDKYKTPRNLASGSVRQLDSSIAKDRCLHFYCFNVLEGLDEAIYKTEKLETINKLGFTVVPFTTISTEWADRIPSIMEDLKSVANDMFLPIDGMVISYDDISYSKSLGSTSHHNNDGLAFKEIDEKEETILRSVEWQPSRTGNLNPVAIFDTVILDGTDVSRASLSNLSIMENLDLAIGSRILVSKRNMIIPYVEDNLDRYSMINEDNKSITKLEIPEKCTCCNHPTFIDESGSSKFLKCSNPMCKTKMVTRIQHYASRDCMNIDGLSEATIIKLMDAEILDNFLDIYKLEEHKSTILKLEGFGKKSYEKLINNINKSREVKLSNFISSLGISNVGQSSGKAIAKHFNYNFGDFYNGLNEGFNFTKLDDFGTTINKNIYDWFNNIEERKMILSIAKQLRFVKDEDTKHENSGMFKGKIFVITGSMKTMKRNDIKDLIEDLGGKVSGSVSKNTTALIYGDKAGSKLDKAKELGTKLITEEEFVEIVGL